MGPLNDHTEHKYRKLLKLAVDYLTRLSNFKETISVSWDMPPNSHPAPPTPLRKHTYLPIPIRLSVGRYVEQGKSCRNSCSHPRRVKRPRTDPFDKRGKEGTKRDVERWLRLWARPVSLSFLSEETAHGSFTCPMSILQITNFRCFVSRMSTFPGYISVPACLAICPHAPLIPK